VQDSCGLFPNRLVLLLHAAMARQIRCRLAPPQFRATLWPPLQAFAASSPLLVARRSLIVTHPHSACTEGRSGRAVRQYQDDGVNTKIPTLKSTTMPATIAANADILAASVTARLL